MDEKKMETEKKPVASKGGQTKILLIGIVLLCVIVAVAISFYDKPETEKPAPVQLVQESKPEAEATEPDAETGEAAVEEETKAMDYDELYTAYAPDEIVLTVGGDPVTWKEFYSWLKQYGKNAEYYIMVYKYYYGYDMSWEDFAPDVVNYAKQQFAYMKAIKNYSAENGVEATEEQLQAIWDRLDEDVAAQYGEATEENKKQYLADMEMTEQEYYDNQYTNILYEGIRAVKFGENGALVDDETAIEYLENNGYMRANHILLTTVDLSSGEALSEEEIARKTELANEIAEELKAITKTDDLLKKFAELKTKYCEDTGKEAYPDGYVFGSGKMVQEFENATKELGEYEVSAPVLSSYGYHIIIRLPLDPDAVIEYSSTDNSPVTARSKYADESFQLLVDGEMQKVEIVEADCLKAFDILKYVH